MQKSPGHNFLLKRTYRIECATAALKANGVRVWVLGAVDPPRLPKNEHIRPIFYR